MPETEDEKPPIFVFVCRHYRGCGRCRMVHAGAGRSHARFRQAVERVKQTGLTPIENVVVGEHAAIELSSGETGHIARSHAVVNLLIRRHAVMRDAGFKIDDPQIRLLRIQFRQRLAPDIGEVHRSWDRPAPCLSQSDVAARIPDHRLEQARLCRMRQDLIDPASSHHITAEKQANAHRRLPAFSLQRRRSPRLALPPTATQPQEAASAGRFSRSIVSMAAAAAPSPACSDTCTVGNANLMPFSSKAFLISA
jgi:hypothetical protein